MPTKDSMECVVEDIFRRGGLGMGHRFIHDFLFIRDVMCVGCGMFSFGDIGRPFVEEVGEMEKSASRALLLAGCC